MNADLKQHGLRLLRHPADQSALRALIEAVEVEAPALATRLRDFVERGTMEPHGFILSEEMRDLVKVLYVVVRVVPKPVAVRFACECAKKVLPPFDRVHPAERTPRELVELVEAWTHGKATKKAVKDKFGQVQEVANRIDREWHAAYAEGAFDSLPKHEFDLTNQPLFTIDVVLAAAGAVVAAPAAALSNVDQAVSKCIEAESIGGNGRTREATVAWLTERLEALVNEADP